MLHACSLLAGRIQVPALRLFPHPCSHSGAAPRCSDLTLEQRRLAEITEMIHTASLVHDDVLDECSVRRGAASTVTSIQCKLYSFACICGGNLNLPSGRLKDSARRCALSAGVATVNAKYGTRTAVMLGDFLFAQSSWFLANLNNLEVPGETPCHERQNRRVCGLSSVLTLLLLVHDLAHSEESAKQLAVGITCPHVAGSRHLSLIEQCSDIIVRLCQSRPT